MDAWRVYTRISVIEAPSPPPAIKLFLCGDVMTGRGIDQILAHPGEPQLYEPYMRSALGYVELARQASGPIPEAVDSDYIWGDALAELERARPDARIVNLETSVTRSNDAWPDKGIHYRMHPANAGCLAAARLDCCTLANNHVLDWGRSGLAETIETLRSIGIRTAGAGADETEASAPAVIDLPRGRRVLVFAFAMASSGVPTGWAATRKRSGVNVLADLSARSAESIARQVQAVKRRGDVAILSIHWGGNWGYSISPEEREFAHRLIDGAGIDLIHGHSSHHPKGIEIHRGKAILHGCGDFLNDYEGIRGYEEFLPQLALMYFPALDEDGRLVRFELVPLRIRRLRLERAHGVDALRMRQLLEREGLALGTRIEQAPQDRLLVHARSQIGAPPA